MTPSTYMYMYIQHNEDLYMYMYVIGLGPGGVTCLQKLKAMRGPTINFSTNITVR